MTSNNLVKILGLTNMMKTEEEVTPAAEANGQERIATDFDKSRTNINDLINITMVAVKNLEELADSSQNARYYEALNATLKTAVEANKALLEIHRELRETSIIRKPVENVTNQLFVGSTADLQTIVDNMKKKNDRIRDSETT